MAGERRKLGDLHKASGLQQTQSEELQFLSTPDDTTQNANITKDPTCPRQPMAVSSNTASPLAPLASVGPSSTHSDPWIFPELLPDSVCPRMDNSFFGLDQVHLYRLRTQGQALGPDPSNSLLLGNAIGYQDGASELPQSLDGSFLTLATGGHDEMRPKSDAFSNDITSTMGQNVGNRLRILQGQNPDQSSLNTPSNVAGGFSASQNKAEGFSGVAQSASEWLTTRNIFPQTRPFNGPTAEGSSIMAGPLPNFTSSDTGISGPAHNAGGFSGILPNAIGFSGLSPNATGFSGPLLNAGGFSGPSQNAGCLSVPWQNAGGLSVPFQNAGGLSCPSQNASSFPGPLQYAGGFSDSFISAGGFFAPSQNAVCFSSALRHVGVLSGSSRNAGGLCTQVQSVGDWSLFNTDAGVTGDQSFQLLPRSAVGEAEGNPCQPPSDSHFKPSTDIPAPSYASGQAVAVPKEREDAKDSSYLPRPSSKRGRQPATNKAMTEGIGSGSIQDLKSAAGETGRIGKKNGAAQDSGSVAGETRKRGRKNVTKTPPATSQAPHRMHTAGKPFTDQQVPNLSQAALLQSATASLPTSTLHALPGQLSVPKTSLPPKPCVTSPSSYKIASTPPSAPLSTAGQAPSIPPLTQSSHPPSIACPTPSSQVAKVAAPLHIKRKVPVRKPQLSGHNCSLCKRDLSYAPEGPYVQPTLAPEVAVLPCGHCFHGLCLQRITPEDQAKQPPCIPCAMGEK